VDKPITQTCTFKLSKPRRSISGEFDLTKMVLKFSFNTTTHNDTQETITKLRRTVLPHTPHSSDLAPSELHLFAAHKDAISRKRCGSGCENRI
jgi:hypothetical protein